MSLLVIKELNVGENHTEIPILKKINLRIDRNQIVALIGESGAGKSLLARAIVGLLPHNLNILSGNFYYSGQPIPAGYLKKMRGKKIFFTPQNAASSLNQMIKIKNQIDESSGIGMRKIENILIDLNFTDPVKVLNSYAFELSDGENQRCLLAMAIAINPEFLILDEPTASLDFNSQNDFIAILKRIHAKYHITVLILTHNIQIIKKISDYVYIMKDGGIVEKGAWPSIFFSPSHDYSKKIIQFF